MADAILETQEPMPHAIRYERQYDHDGKLLLETTHHYLTCHQCEIERERQANGRIAAEPTGSIS